MLRFELPAGHRPHRLLPLLLAAVVVLLASCPSRCQEYDLDAITLLAGYDGGAQLVMADLALAYSLVAADTRLNTSSVSGMPAAIETGELDFAALSTALTAAQVAAYPNLQMFPFTCFAVVPIYRLDALGPLQLVLDRQTLAMIYLGEITWWNDSRIQADNSAAMPHQRIVMAMPTMGSGSASNLVWTQALSKFYAPFASTVGASSNPAWPYSLYFAYYFGSGRGVSGQPSQVVSHDGSLGYAYHSVALEMQLAVAALVNKAGLTVTAGVESVTFATVELGTQLRSSTTAGMDLTDGSGASVWPISMMSFILIDTQLSRSTCRVREAAVQFWLWFFTSSVTTGLLASRQYAPVPSIVLSQLDVIGQLQTAVFCRGAPALPAVVTTTRIMGAPSVGFLSSLLCNLYLAVEPQVLWTVQTNGDDVTLQQLVDSEIDLAFIDPGNVEAGFLQAVIDSPDFLLLPTYLIAPAVAYNPQITSSLSIAGYSLTLDTATVGMMLYGCIVDWNDPLILQQNSWLAALLPPLNETAVPISRVSGCGTTPQTAPLTLALYEALAASAAESGDSGLGWCIGNVSASLTADFDDCVSVPALNLLYVASESSVPPLILGVKGAIGIMQNSGDPSYGIIRLTDVRGGVAVNTSATAAGMAACVPASLDVTQLNTGLALNFSAGGQAAQCYRPTQQVVAVLRTDYYSAAGNSSGCDRGYDTLLFLQWFYSTALIDGAVSSENEVRVSALSPLILHGYLAALAAVTCDTETLLVTQPVAWQLSPGIAGFVNALSALGLLGCLALGLVVFVYRSHPVMRSASPIFLLLSLAGVGLMFTSGFLLVARVSSASCAGFSWLLNFGLTLCFAPLFAKTWRIYRIFGRKKLSVVLISNARLLLLCAALLALEAVLQAAWTAVGQLSPMLSLVTTSSQTVLSVSTGVTRFVIDSYSQCGVAAGSSSQSLFIAVMVEKAAVFCFGALMAFTTRKVHSTFNESQGITLAIYNVIFTCGIIAPIILVIQAVGDVLTLLLAFALLWIAYFTMIVLFVPKILKVTAKQADGQTGNTSIMASDSSSSGYRFMSLAALSTAPLLQGYHQALLKHLAAVDRRLAQLRGAKSVGSQPPTVSSGSKIATAKAAAASDGPNSPAATSPSLRRSPVNSAAGSEEAQMAKQRRGSSGNSTIVPSSRAAAASISINSASPAGSDSPSADETAGIDGRLATLLGRRLLPADSPSTRHTHSTSTPALAAAQD